MIKQRSIKNSIYARGVTLHSGVFVNLSLNPAPKNTGIIFRRVDLKPILEIKAFAFNVDNTEMATTLSLNSVSVNTIEHIMAALAGFWIDNIYIDIDGPEIPILDGSSSYFIFLIQAAGLVIQEEEKKFIRIKKEVTIKDCNKSATLKPYNGFRLEFEIDFNHNFLKSENNFFAFDFSSMNFIQLISRARTFGFTRDLEYLRKNNLAQGASENNAIIIDDNGIVNESGLYYENELVRHKILDAIGDIYLIGYSVIGLYKGFKSGHKLNNKLIRKLLNDSDAYEIVSFNEELDDLPTNYINFN